MRFLRRSLVGLFLMAVTLGVLAFAANAIMTAVQARMADEGGASRARERVFAVNVIEVTPGAISPVLESFGELRARRSLELRATSGGRVLELGPGVEEGGVVTKGQLIAQIDTTDAAANLEVAGADLHEAEAELREAERALEIAGDDLAAAQAQLDLRVAALSRQRALQERGVVTESTVETAALSEASARQAVLSKRSALAQAEARLDQANTGLLRTRISHAEAERALADTTLTAGFDGTLSDVTITEGGLVTANEQVATLIDPGDLEVAFRVSTQAYARLVDANGRLSGAPVTVSLDLSGVSIETTGRVSRESAVVAEGQSGRLLFATLESAAGLRPGDFVTVSLIEPELRGVALLPGAAVGSDGMALALDAGNRLETIAAPVLRRQGDEVLVDARALAGRTIVAERSPLLGAGIQVRPMGGTGHSEGEGAAAPAPEVIALDDERRARLIAFVKGNTRMPAEAKERILAALNQPEVPTDMIERLESRMGG